MARARVGPVSGMPIVEAAEGFLAHSKAKGVAPRTLIAYDVAINSNFLKWVESEGLETLDQLDGMALDRFNLWVRSSAPTGKARAEATVDAYIRPVNTLLNWAEKQSLNGSSKARTTRPQRTTERMVDILTEAEIDRMENAANWERDKLIIRVLADTGCRRGECLGITPEAIMKEPGVPRAMHFIYFRKPGRMTNGHSLKRHERKVPIGPKLYGRLQAFIKTLPPDREGDYIFLASKARWNRGGTASNRTALRGDSLTQMIRFVAAHAGVSSPKRKVFPHLFRHTFISSCWSNGVELLTCAKWVGHDDLEMIQRVYGHPTDQSSYQAMIDLIDKRKR